MLVKTDGDKFFLRPLISKQHSSMTIGLSHPSKSAPPSPSFNGGVSVGVPFLWESKPGTPMHASSSNTGTTLSSADHIFLPLNPPPRTTYNRNVPQTPMRIPSRRSKSFSFRSLFPTKFLKNKSRHSVDCDAALAPESLSPSSSSSASTSVPSSPVIRYLPIFRRSHSTSIGHNKSVFDHDFHDDPNSASVVSRGFAPCFRASSIHY